ncbi:hypothetical protein C8R46DRAFT_1114588, partial [Mycena filopes]
MPSARPRGRPQTSTPEILLTAWSLVCSYLVNGDSAETRKDRRNFISVWNNSPLRGDKGDEVLEKAVEIVTMTMPSTCEGNVAIESAWDNSFGTDSQGSFAADLPVAKWNRSPEAVVQEAWEFWWTHIYGDGFEMESLNRWFQILEQIPSYESEAVQTACAVLEMIRSGHAHKDVEDAWEACNLPAY